MKPIKCYAVFDDSGVLYLTRSDEAAEKWVKSGPGRWVIEGEFVTADYIEQLKDDVTNDCYDSFVDQGVI